MKFLLATAFLCSTAYAQINMIWLQTAYPECNSCLDQDFASCPGDYQSVGYATCMCKGDGGPNTVTCAGICDRADTVGTNVASHVASSYYRYCIMFFREFCTDAKEYLDQETFDERCGPDAGPGLGDAEVVSDTETSTGGSPPSTVTGSSPLETNSASFNGAETTKSSSVSAPPEADSTARPSSTSGRSSSPSSSGGPGSVSGSATVSAAGATVIPSNAASMASNPYGWGVVFGFGLQLAGMNM
ncbi:hypothetical protein BKA65DRAFT_489051 [Rhexocercosporidium sp. MPI-PUGE-AT-0058]|nr:hypothetical protein BKA65DRAFT_489051 [Rhexocercosporidium sp. MPI-PUGE-AT-0058]